MSKHLFAFVKGIKKNDKGEKVFTAVASTIGLDRDRDILIPKGVEIENYIKNPVMLDIHNYGKHSIGKTVDIRVNDENIEFDFIFAQTDEGKKVEYLYENDFQKAFSVGFLPKKWHKLTDLTKKDGMWVVPIEEGKEFLLKEEYLKGVPEDKVNYIISKWELLEISPVPVPANPEALLRAGGKLFAIGKSEISNMLIEEELKRFIKSLETKIDEVEKYKGVIPYTSHDIDDKSAWDANKARKDFAVYASEDGSGSKDKIDWNKYAKGFTWYDTEKKENLTSYKFPHHYVNDGNIVTVWRGVVAAMVRLLQNKEAYGDDAEGIYNHLAKHYADFGKEAPDFEKSWTEEELKQYEKEVLKESDGQDNDDDNNADNKVSELEKIKEILVEIKDVLKELQIGYNVDINIVKEMLMELTKNTDTVTDDDTKNDNTEKPKEFLESLLKKLDIT